MTIKESTTTSIQHCAIVLSRIRVMKTLTLSISAVAAIPKTTVCIRPKIMIQDFLRDPKIGTESAVIP